MVFAALHYKIDDPLVCFLIWNQFSVCNDCKKTMSSHNLCVCDILRKFSELILKLEICLKNGIPCSPNKLSNALSFWKLLAFIYMYICFIFSEVNEIEFVCSYFIHVRVDEDCYYFGKYEENSLHHSFDSEETLNRRYVMKKKTLNWRNINN